jgi:hypothetical protein
VKYSMFQICVSNCIGCKALLLICCATAPHVVFTYVTSGNRALLGMCLVARVFVTQIDKHIGSGYSAVHVPGNLLFGIEVSDFPSLWCLCEVVLELVPKRKHTLKYKYMS